MTILSSLLRLCLCVTGASAAGLVRRETNVQHSGEAQKAVEEKGFISANGHGALIQTGSSNEETQGQAGVPQHIPDARIPAPLLHEADRCAGSWKTNVMTPRLTTQEELSEPNVKEIMGRYHEEPIMHRKQWEYVFLLKILDALPTMHKAVGFAVGEEPTVSYLASKNVTVVATDLPPDAKQAAAWQATNQLMNTNDLNARHIATTEQMSHVSSEFVDMNTLEKTNVWKQAGTFDLVWSICSVEHTGSLRQALDFMVKSLHLLRPGGSAVHTTEFNIASLGSTVDHQGTVLFRKSDIDAFHNCAVKKGYEMVRPCYDVSSGAVDREYDTPPYSHDRHLRLEIDKYISTCVGMVVRKPENFVDTGYECDWGQLN